MIDRIRFHFAAARPTSLPASLPRVLAAMSNVPREEFVVEQGRMLAYMDFPQNIGHGQTISSPRIVALMTSALELLPSDNILDIGTGSGYQAAVLDGLTGQVASIEIVRPLAWKAARRLRRLHYARVTVRAGDGYRGWPEKAPFDAILVAAGAQSVPLPLLDQLKIRGRLVMPIGKPGQMEQLTLVTRQSDRKFERCSLGYTRFVPLTGLGAVGSDSDEPDAPLPFCFGASLT